MTYVNKSAYWGPIDETVTPQWYGQRAVVLGVEPPDIVVTRVGLVINGEIVAVPAE